MDLFLLSSIMFTIFQNTKCIFKKLSAADTETVERQKRKEERRIEKLKNPVQHSRYKYDAPEIEIKETQIILTYLVFFNF